MAEGTKRLLGKTGLNKPVMKSQKVPITIMACVVCCLLVSVAWYIFTYLPLKHKAEADEIAKEIANKQLADEQAAEIARQKAEAAAAAAAKGAFAVVTVPPGATVQIGDTHTTSPVNVTDVTPGPYTVIITLDGYEDYKTDVNIAPDKPIDLGTVTLVAKTATLNLTTGESDVIYTLTGPKGFTKSGALPDKIGDLPVGDYTLDVSQKDWKLPSIAFSLADHDNVTKEIKFPFAKLTLQTTPPGATVRDGRTIVGTTPLVLSKVHPGEFHYSLDLPPYTLQHVDIHVPDFGNITKQVALAKDKDFLAACGMPMVWIPDGGFWAAKFPFRQCDFEKVAGYNPSFFRGPNMPVESISWESALVFIEKLNAYEGKAGRLPAGFHYSLPSESQWDTYNADTDMSTAAISSNTPLTSTQDVGYSAPNKYGLYDTIGNVWEWCLDEYDDKGDHTLRGGTWLSLPTNFSGPGARQGGPPKYADKLVGFRVVLVPNA